MPPPDHGLAISWAILVAVTAVSAVVIWWNLNREAQTLNRRDAGRCVVCDYDLRATPGRCPECGTVVTPGLPLTCTMEVTALMGDWPASPITPRQPAADEHPVLLFDTHNGFQADLLVEQLRSRGVDARLHRGKPLTIVSGIEERQTVFWKVVIWSGDVERAYRIVQQLERRRPNVVSSRGAP